MAEMMLFSSVSAIIWRVFVSFLDILFSFSSASFRVSSSVERESVAVSMMARLAWRSWR